MRTSFNALVSVLLGALVFGCSSISVNHSFDPAADFSRLETFGWMSSPEVSPAEDLELRNIRFALKQQLGAKGFTEDESAPDFLVAIHGGRERRVDVQQWGYGYADRAYFYGRRGRWGSVAAPPARIDYRRGTDTFEYDIGTLILDFVDPPTKQLIWRGVATAVVDDPVSPKKIDQAVAKLLENFPPGTK